MKSAKSLGFCFLAGQRKKKTKRFCYLRGGKQTPVCSRTVHSSTVVINSSEITPPLKKELEIQIDEYEKPIKELIGKEIQEVKYYELDYEVKEERPYWDEVNFHSLDYGIQFITSDNNLYYFIWGNQFVGYDLKFANGNIKTEFTEENGAEEYEVKNNEKWTELIGQKIVGIQSNWSYYKYQGKTDKHYYPQDVQIKFENGKNIFISALEISNDKPMGMKDHITIVFDQNMADKYRIGIKNVVEQNKTRMVF